jgi:hypothetical protein
MGSLANGRGRAKMAWGRARFSLILNPPVGLRCRYVPQPLAREVANNLNFGKGSGRLARMLYCRGGCPRRAVPGIDGSSDRECSGDDATGNQSMMTNGSRPRRAVKQTDRSEKKSKKDSAR